MIEAITRMMAKQNRFMILNEAMAMIMGKQYRFMIIIEDELALVQESESNHSNAKKHLSLLVFVCHNDVCTMSNGIIPP